MTESGTKQPTCDHRDHRGKDGEKVEHVPAVAQYEGMHPPTGPVFRYWACAEHAPDGPALQRIDPGPENRTEGQP